MNFADYQPLAAKTAVYPRTVGDFGMAYCALKLSGEAAELGDKLDELTNAPLEAADALRVTARKEAGDVYWYIAGLAREAQLDIPEPDAPAWFASPRDCATYLGRRAGAVSEIVGKTYRDHDGILSDDKRVALTTALSDMLAALAWLVVSTLDATVSEVLSANIAKLRDRQQRGVLHGSGDER